MAKSLYVLPFPVTQFTDANGAPLAGGKVFTYAAGTTTLQATFTDVLGLQPNTNPIILDAFGKATIYLDTVAYKIDVQNAAGVSQAGYPMDNISSINAFGSVIYTPPAADGAVGAVLTTSGAKILSWTPQAWANDFRLTLTTGLPVTTADVTAATTLYCSPYSGNRLDLPDANGNPIRYTSAEFSIAVPATTVTMYDVFAYANAGVPTLELLAWTSDTVRATAIVRTNGRWMKSGDSTRLYVASFRTTGVSGQTEDSILKRYLWNYYNRVPRRFRMVEATASWTYTLATWRQANAGAANQVDLVVGVQEVMLRLSLQGFATNAGAAQANVAFGEDSTTVPSANQVGGFTTTVATTTNSSPRADLAIYPAIGRHFYAWLEYSSAVGTTTWWSTNTSLANGITGTIDG